MKIGYARVSKADQTPQLQLDALAGAGCEKVFHEQISSGKDTRPQLQRALAYCSKGDTLVVWKMDRLARSTSQTYAIVEQLKAKGVNLQIITLAIDTSTPTGALLFAV